MITITRALRKGIEAYPEQTFNSYKGCFAGTIDKGLTELEQGGSIRQLLPVIVPCECPLCEYSEDVLGIVMHLNDRHRKSREWILEWYLSKYPDTGPMVVSDEEITEVEELEEILV